MCRNTYFYIVFLNINQKWPKNGPPKKDNFSDFTNTGYNKKTICCNPPFDQTLAFFNLCFLKPTTLRLSKKHNWESGKTKIRKRDLKEKTRQETKQRERIDEKHVIESLDVVFHEKKTKKTEKEREKTRNQKKAKKKDKKEERKKRTRERERQRKRNWKRGRPKKAKEKQSETLQNNKTCPSLGGNTGFFF